MALFFIDTSDEDAFCRDETGFDLPDVEAAKTAAIAALPGMARDVFSDCDQYTLFAIIRDQDGRSLLRVTLKLSVEPFLAASSIHPQTIL